MTGGLSWGAMADQEGAVPYRKFYDEERARSYGQAKETARGTHRAECRLVERALRGIDRSESIVDVPCGDGRVTPLLAHLGFHPVAADVSPAMVELAQRRFAGLGLAIPVEERDLEATGWPDGAFDNLFSFRFFHHLPTDALRAQVAREMCRVARRRVLVSYLDARSWTSRRREREARRRGRGPGKHAQRPEEMAAWFERAGFRVVADHARLPLVHSLRLLVAERVPG
jgi:SAM-dependent methyltransferase